MFHFIGNASEQFKTVHNDATKEIGAAFEIDAYLCHVRYGWHCFQSEHLFRIDIVRIEWLAVQRLTGRIFKNEEAVLAGKTALELDGKRTDGGWLFEQYNNVLRCTLYEGAE